MVYKVLHDLTSVFLFAWILILQLYWDSFFSESCQRYFCPRGFVWAVFSGWDTFPSNLYLTDFFSSFMAPEQQYLLKGAFLDTTLSPCLIFLLSISCLLPNITYLLLFVFFVCPMVQTRIWISVDKEVCLSCSMPDAHTQVQLLVSI